MQKIQITLEAQKLRNLISKRSYQNKEGQNVEVQEVKFDLIEMKPESQKEVYNHDKFTLVKTHFAVAQQTKEEREAKADVIYIGEGITQFWKDEIPKMQQPNDIAEGLDDDIDPLPF